MHLPSGAGSAQECTIPPLYQTGRRPLVTPRKHGISGDEFFVVESDDAFEPHEIKDDAIGPQGVPADE